MDKLTTPRNRFALPWGPRKTYPQIAQIYADFGEGLDVKVEDGFSNPSIIYYDGLEHPMSELITHGAR